MQERVKSIEEREGQLMRTVDGGKCVKCNLLLANLFPTLS